MGVALEKFPGRGFRWTFIEDDQKVIYFHLVKELHCP